MSETVLVDDDRKGVVTITLNRPETLNAFNFEMLHAFGAAFEAADRDPNCRVIVLTGAGRGFCAGADVKAFKEGMFTAAKLKPVFFKQHEMPDVVVLVEQSLTPVIAAVNGVAVGEGVELALASDFRIASTSARLGFPEVKIGLIPASGGCSRIVKHIGLMKAKELILRGTVLDADEALANGLVTEVVAPEELPAAVAALASELVEKAPLALGMAKAVLTACSGTDLTTGHMVEILAQNVLIKTDDHLEGVAAFSEKRPPAWVGY